MCTSSFNSVNQSITDNVGVKENISHANSPTWQEIWDANRIRFHQKNVDLDLQKHESLLAGGKKRIFLPLCGKSLDIRFLAEKGYDVYGCELVEKAIKDFFIEQDLKYVVTNVGAFVVYKAVKQSITLFQGDFFELKSEVFGKFDAIWDRASLVVMKADKRIQYATVIHDLMAPNCKYLLNSFLFTAKDYKGPPYTISYDDIENIFGKFCNIQLLDTKKVSFYLPTSDFVHITNTLLTLKQ